MILADKILAMRKKNGWSQEELTDKMNVSRQSISKWESAASIPDINKILELARVFGVSTDYLLKDELEQAGPEDAVEEDHGGPVVTLQQAKDYMEHKRRSGRIVGLGVALCILSPVLLILLGGLVEGNPWGIYATERTAGGVGIVVLLLMVAAAVAIFIFNGMKDQPYQFLSKNDFQLEYGVAGVVREKKNAYLKRYTIITSIAVAICILSAAPLVAGACYEVNDCVLILFVCLLLVMLAGAVYLFIASGGIKESYDQLLKEEEFDRNEVNHNSRADRFAGFYWPIVTAIYLGWSFLSRDWKITWVVWPVAALISAAIHALLYKEEE